MKLLLLFLLYIGLIIPPSPVGLSADWTVRPSADWTVRPSVDWTVDWLILHENNSQYKVLPLVIFTLVLRMVFAGAGGLKGEAGGLCLLANFRFKN